jgi:hypothetical protein
LTQCRRRRIRNLQRPPRCFAGQYFRFALVRPCFARSPPPCAGFCLSILPHAPLVSFIHA